MQPADQQQLQGVGPMDPMDPNMMLPEEPQPENIMDYAVEFNPHRKTLEVFLMIAMLMTCIGVAGYCGLSYLIVEHFFSAGGLFALVDEKLELCLDEACGEYEHRTMGFVDWSARECDDYFSFACEGFKKEAVDFNYDLYEPYHETIALEYEIILDLLFHDAPDDWPSDFIKHHETVRSWYTFCRTAENVHTDVLGELVQTKGESLIDFGIKATRFYPLFPFYIVIPVESSSSCYVYPSERFLPTQMYSDDERVKEFTIAFMEYLQETGYDDIAEAKTYVDLFFSIEKQLAEAEVISLHYCQGKKYIWSDKSYFESLAAILAGLTVDQFKSYLIMYVLQGWSLFGKKETPLARLHYRYVKLVIEPPPPEIRCIDFLEPMMQPYYLDNLRRAHVLQRNDLKPVSQEKAELAMKNLVGVLKTFFFDSALSSADIDTASDILEKLQFKLFYPGSLKDPGFSKGHTASVTATSAARATGAKLEMLKNSLGTFTSEIFNLRRSWPIPTFSHEPRYFHGINTIYVPYAVFAWAYMDIDSKLPFSIPVYGFKIIRELFKAIDYRAHWWVNQSGTRTEANYKRIEDCVARLESNYEIKKPVERYETIAEIAAVHVLAKMFNDKIKHRNEVVDVRLPFHKHVPSQTQFFIALASELCSRTSAGVNVSLKSEYGYKTAEVRMEILATHLPSYTTHFRCSILDKMHYSFRYSECLFWNR